MMAFSFHFLCFEIYPYLVLAVFLLGSFLRFRLAPYSCKADSSQFLRRGLLVWGSFLFHIGILFLLCGHFFGLLTPHWLYMSFGITPPAKQLVAMLSGGVMGGIAFIGGMLLLGRRLFDPRIRKASRKMDIFILIWVMLTLFLGLGTIAFSRQHMDGKVMMLLADWVQAIVTFRPASAYLLEVPMIYKCHMMMGMTLFLLFPFSRLIHIWSGFASVFYLVRPPQIVRRPFEKK